jgi:hypothetical protein
LRRLFNLISLVAAVAALNTGCAVNRMSANVDPSAKLDTMKTMHVQKLAADGRNIDGLIADKLRTRGFTVTTGAPPASGVDAVVTYVDKWMWDITMYMLELTVTVRDPKTDYPLATGNSYHTSLTRKSPTEMVDEVVNNILKEGKVK